MGTCVAEKLSPPQWNMDPNTRDFYFYFWAENDLTLNISDGSANFFPFLDDVRLMSLAQTEIDFPWS